MLSMQGFVFLEKIIMNNGLPVIYDYNFFLCSIHLCDNEDCDSLL